MYTILKLILYPHSLLFKFIYCVMELRPYQQEVFDLINSNNQYYFQLPCGTGKNIIISEYINRYPEYRYAVFSPSIYLANEMCRLINRPVNRIFSDKGTEEEYEKIDDKTYIISGSMPIYDVNKILESHIPEGDYDTLSGYLQEELGRIPSEEENPTIETEELTFKIEEYEDKRILKVKVCKNEEA